MAGRTSGDSLVMRCTFKMTEETDIQGNLHMLSLNNIRMAASAVKFYISFHLSEMFFVIEGYSSFCENNP
jgi:hypothetical protein